MITSDWSSGDSDIAASVMSSDSFFSPSVVGSTLSAGDVPNGRQPSGLPARLPVARSATWAAGALWTGVVEPARSAVSLATSGTP